MSKDIKSEEHLESLMGEVGDLALSYAYNFGWIDEAETKNAMKRNTG